MKFSHRVQREMENGKRKILFDYFPFSVFHFPFLRFAVSYFGIHNL